MVNTNALPEQLKKKNIEEKLETLCIENDVVFMALFGSYVRGEQKEKSDVDIGIKYDSERKKSLLDLIDLKFKLRRIWGKKVDLGIIDALNPNIIEDVKKEMIVLYEKR